MPKFKNYCDEPVIELELNLHGGKELIYDKNQADYLNWIPYILTLTVGKQKYVLDDMSFSIEGLNCFFYKMQYILSERSSTTEYKAVDYCGSENEFEIIFRNVDDYFEDLIIQTEIWINAACLPVSQSGYLVGYKFNIKYNDLEQFVKDLRKQLQALLQNL